MTNINDNYEQVVGDFSNKVKGLDTQINTIEQQLENVERPTQEQVQNAINKAIEDGKITGTLNTRDVVDGEIFIVGSSSGGESTAYTITNNLTNTTNSNNATSINKDSSYVAKIIANSGYVMSNVIVLMGGTDITSTVYSNGNINISKVIGNLIITAVAEKESNSIDIPSNDLLAYYDMSRELFEGKIKDLAHGNDLIIEKNGVVENGYLKNTGDGLNGNYINSPTTTYPSTIDISGGYTLIVSASGLSNSTQTIFSTDGGIKNCQLLNFQGGLVHYNEGGFNNSATSTIIDSNKHTIALTWTPLGNDTIYIDGIQKYQSITKVNKIGNKIYLLNGYGDVVTNIRIHKFALYSSELSQAQITQITNIFGGNN